MGRDLVREVIPSEPQNWDQPLSAWAKLESPSDLAGDESPDLHVVALDFGMKWNIPRHFASRGNQVTIVPGNTSADEIRRLEPDGVFLSNGPGDPEPIGYAYQTISDLIGTTPIFGICLGHQLLSLACGAKTFKLKFGHHGGNQPIKELGSGRVVITSQNHGFALDEDTLPDHVKATHRSLFDGSLQGIELANGRAFGF